jgi:outer membrane protein
VVFAYVRRENRSMKRLFYLTPVPVVIAFCFLYLTEVIAAEPPQTKIAVINMQKVVRQSAAGQKAMEQLNQRFEQLQKELQASQDELKTYKEDLEKKAPLMNEEARADKEREYKKMVRDFKDKSEDAQFEMRQAESKTMEPILKDLEKVVTKLGQERSYTLILENNMPGVYYVDPSIDITDEIINACDEAAKKKAD